MLLPRLLQSTKHTGYTASDDYTNHVKRTMNEANRSAIDRNYDHSEESR